MFKVGDKIIIKRANNHSNNGKIGIITDIINDEEEQKAKIKLDDSGKYLIYYTYKIDLLQERNEV